MSDVAEVGGKAASLGELMAAGVRVPDGIVLGAAAGDMSSEERRWLSGAGALDLGPGPFAVRSSGIAEDGVDRSFAGIYESVLNVSADDVPAAI
ncbi:MAG TPA: PEP/pyruvate-binding domain-containing protein, partial [Candidatus Limnocylindria bacterium]